MSTAKAERTRQRILDAALRLFAERGYAHTTVRDIAREAECATGLLYRYFPRREALVIALYGQLTDDLARDVAALSSGTLAYRFAGLMHQKVELLVPYREAFVGLVGAALDPSSGVGVLGAETDALRARIESLFQMVVAGSTDLRDPPDSLARILFVLHLGILLVWTQDRSVRAERTHRLIDLTGEGLRLAGPMLPLAQPMLDRLATLVGEFFESQPTAD